MRLFKMPPLYARASIATGACLMLWGLDTGSIGPITAMETFKASFGHFSAILHGAIVSTLLITGTISALLAGMLADQLGRVAMISTGAAVFGLGAAIECGAVHLAMFIAGRAVKGLGTGLFVSTVAVQICEITPAKTRGFWVAFSQFMLTVGLSLGYFICYGTRRVADSSASWRVPLAAEAILGFGLAATTLFVPQSPRWLMAKGQVDKARLVFTQLGISEEEQREMLASKGGQEAAAAVVHPPNMSMAGTIRATIKDFRKALSKPFRSRTAFGCFLMVAQQTSFIDGILYYAPLLFRQSGLSEETTFLCSGVLALVIMVVTIPATIFTDSWGRRTCTIVGGAGIAILMFLMGSLYAANQVRVDGGAGRWVVIVSIYLFAIVFNGTWAICIKAFLVESLPRETRSSGAALGQAANWLANFVVALTAPPFLAASSSGPYFFYGGCTLVSVVVCAVWMTETKSQSLEAIEAAYLERKSGKVDEKMTWTTTTEGLSGSEEN
ncbi:sugar transport protein [Colletotrichum scovillei]|uniref:Sugar transport protein n=1 Tax=Colletotrichum scovillei TaxID=1209932 RepID=A0A9P7RII9_9PEZI|nr:sugar transport protein [Colletotrichum scovillei]KAF4777990.1 sugar transport protein [Colletotrichum scovillei]KAG7058986.1 sugar transport protein [Colletotrichum scovillei]KAG7077598.1 sugar transport protein [Colletotrichum scovillei]KAG7084761.1 sugar transport protein [Colletotrichum scovillei]